MLQLKVFVYLDVYYGEKGAVIESCEFEQWYQTKERRVDKPGRPGSARTWKYTVIKNSTGAWNLASYEREQVKVEINDQHLLEVLETLKLRWHN